MPPSRNHTLHFAEDGTFQISVFEDLHFAENDGNDVKTQQVIRSVLHSEDAQLVVLNGDLISGDVIQTSDPAHYVHYIHDVVAPLVDEDHLWASTYGNHDSNPNLDPLMDIYSLEKQYSTSLTQSYISGPEAGITNYYLPVYPHGNPDGPPALLLWFFDSRGGYRASNRNTKASQGLRGDWVHESVVEWFTETKAKLTAEHGHLPSLAFYHIPAHAMMAVQEEGIDPNTAPGLNGETVVPQGGGDTDYGGQDEKFMQALRDTPGLIATFSGHDHDNDWCFKWQSGDEKVAEAGLNMCYGRHTGHNGYGKAARGGRQILLDQKAMASEVQTWIRLEDGSITNSVTLNRTYGEDHYVPAFTGKGPDFFPSSEGYMPWPLVLLIMCLAVCSTIFWKKKRNGSW